MLTTYSHQDFNAREAKIPGEAIQVANQHPKRAKMAKCFRLDRWQGLSRWVYRISYFHVMQYSTTTRFRDLLTFTTNSKKRATVCTYLAPGASCTDSAGRDATLYQHDPQKGLTPR